MEANIPSVFLEHINFDGNLSLGNENAANVCS